MCKVKLPMRYEMDNAKGQIIGLLKAYGYRHDMQDYVRDCWEAITSGNGRHALTLHICAWHAKRFIFKNIEESYASLNSNMKGAVISTLKTWVEVFLKSPTSSSFVERLRQIIIITGTPAKTTLVLETVNKIFTRSPVTGTR